MSASQTTLYCHCRELIYDVEMGIRTCGHPDDEEVVCTMCSGEGCVSEHGPSSVENPDAWTCELCEGYGQIPRCEAEGV